MFRKLGDTWRNLVAGTRLALMLRIGPEEFRTTTSHATLMLVVVVVFDILWLGLRTLPSPLINHDVLVYLAATNFTLFIAIFVVGGIQGAQMSIAPLVVVVLAGSWCVQLLEYLAFLLAEQFDLPIRDGWRVAIIPAPFFLWLLAVYFRSIRLTYRPTVLRTAGLSIVFAICLLAPRLPLRPPALWDQAPPAVAETDRFADINVEKVYYDQYWRVDDATSELAAQRPGVVDLYFVGFAGWASQDVFYREIMASRMIFDNRFDTKERSVLLINNPKTVEEFPVANVHNLDQVLGNLAEKMDVNDDVLFLFLTSHGSPDGRLAVEFGPLQFNDLTPKRLKWMLDRSHIKNRVLVVSACYSGGFIEPLKDDNTLIITASRADRNSFGCSDEESWTYFGRAYFDEALRHDFSFTDAFDKARKVIAEREAARSFTPSEPQMWVGEAIKPKLAALEARLRARQAASAEKAAAAGR